MLFQFFYMVHLFDIVLLAYLFHLNMEVEGNLNTSFFARCGFVQIYNCGSSLLRDKGDCMISVLDSFVCLCLCFCHSFYASHKD